jgi:hypothetical protein
MVAITRLYRFPVKGLTPEPVERLDVRASGAIAGDRVLGFLFANAGEEQRPGWWGKDYFLTMQNTPGLARVACRFDPDARRLTLTLDGRELASGTVDDETARARLASAIEAAVGAFEVSPLAGRADRSPLRLVGDGNEPRFHDRTSIQVSLVNRASIAALADRVGAEVDERRFRMNATVEELEPWAELEWIGRTVQIGGAEFEVTGPVVRCLATHANPETGERDLEVMQTLTREFGHERPTMGVLAVPRVASTIRVGDEVTAPGG